MTSPDVRPDALRQFQNLLQSSARRSLSDRVQYSLKDKKPVLNDGRTKKIFAAFKNTTLIQQDAYTLHVFETAIVNAQGDENNKAAALLYLSKLSVASAPLRLGDLGSVLMLLTTRDERLIDRYLLLQNLADIIATDESFITLVDRSKKTQIAEIFSKNVFGTTIRMKDGKLKTNTSKGSAAIAIAQNVILPVALTKKCLELCEKSEALVANSAVKNLAMIAKNPLAHLMASVLYANTWSESFSTAISATLKIVMTGVNVGFSPTGASFGAGFKTPASGLIPDGLYTKLAFKVGKKAGTFGLDKLIKTADTLIPESTSDIVPPVFLVRKSFKEGMDPEVIPPGGGKAHSFFDRRLVLSLLAYLSLPIEPEDQWDDSRPHAILKARIMFKNILGSYASEDCVRDLSPGMSAQEYIAERLGFDRLIDLDSVLQKRNPASLKGKRPISFLRLLCVSSGLVPQHSTTADDKKNGQDQVWDGLSYGQPGLSFRSQRRGHNMGRGLTETNWKAHNATRIWRHPQEQQFDTFTAAELQNEQGMFRSYLCRPMISNDTLNDSIQLNQRINQCNVVIETSSYTGLEMSVLVKSRWRRDEESTECKQCSKPLLTSQRHHCRCCGEIFCDTHLMKGAFLTEDALKKLKSDQPGITGLGKQMEKICASCNDLDAEKESFYDFIALKEGHACVRPVFLKRWAHMPSPEQGSG